MTAKTTSLYVADSGLKLRPLVYLFIRNYTQLVPQKIPRTVGSTEMSLRDKHNMK